ncbi:MAG: DNA primase [Cyanobacteria bacterium]|jgi:putative DNA primase/helicase|nr:DNA primase [Cyanobacteria bacterium GSL.Bin21]
MNIGRYEYAKGKDWVKALKELSELAGIPFPEKPFCPDHIKSWEKLETKRNILTHIYEYCRERLWSSTGEKALSYLRSRGYTEDMDEGLKRFQIGYLDNHRCLKEFLLDRGFKQDSIEKVIPSQKWEGYITYPWWDEKGKPLTLYGRYHQEKPPAELPKTLALKGKNTKRSPYLFHVCLENQQRNIVFVEGINDALFLQIKGDKRVCAGVAAEFNKNQWDVLKRNGIENIIHAGDPDTGGDCGTKSNLVNGLGRGINVYVAPPLPHKNDPDYAVKEYGIDWWLDHTSAQQSKHGLTWLAEFICKDIDDLSCDSDKANAIAKAKKEIAKIKADPVTIEVFYWKCIYKLMKISPELIAQLEAQFTKTTTSDLPESFKAVHIATWLIDQYRTNLAFDTEVNDWRRYEAIKNGVWSKEVHEFVWDFVWKEVEKLVELFDKAEISGKLIDEIVKFLKSGLAVRQFDSQGRNKIPFRNGVLDLENNKFQQHAPGFHFTWSLPYDYDRLATCEPIQEWLLETFDGDPDMVELIRAYLYGIIAGRTDWQKYIEMIGAGGTGKSTIIRLAECLVGRENVHTTTLKKLEESRFETATIKDKRLVVVTDSERYAGSVSVLKALTGQDSLPYEVKNKQSTGGFIPDALVLIAGNETIKSSDYTSGLERRRINVPMNHRIPSSKQRQLIEFDRTHTPIGEFAEYIPGLFNWVLGIGPEKATQFVKNYETLVISLVRRKYETLLETNPMADWVNEKIVYRPDVFTKVGTANGSAQYHLYPNYCQYCEEVNIQPVSLKRFSGLLEDLFQNQLGYTDVEKKRKNVGVGFTNITIRNFGDNDPPLVFNDIDEGYEGSMKGHEGSMKDPMKARITNSNGVEENYEGCEGSNQIQFHSKDKNENLSILEADGITSKNPSYPSWDSQPPQKERDETMKGTLHQSYIDSTSSPIAPNPSEKSSDYKPKNIIVGDSVKVCSVFGQLTTHKVESVKEYDGYIWFRTKDGCEFRNDSASLMAVLDQWGYKKWEKSES